MKQNEDQSLITPQQRTRRNFVKKTLAGSALLSLPIKNVWATGTVNVNSSAAASGNGSGGAGLEDREWYLEGPDYWKNNLPSDLRYASFASIFGREAYIAKKSEHEPQRRDGRWLTFDESLYKILQPTRSKFAGCKNYNRVLISLYLNARESGNAHIFYPVVDGNYYRRAEDFASAIIAQSYYNPAFWAVNFENFISSHQGFG